MDISRTSQGGQVTFDTNANTNTNTNTNTTTNTNGSVATTAVTIDSNQNLGTSKSDKAINEKELSKAVERLNKFVEADNITVQYDVHPQFKDLMIKIVDKTTGDVLVEVPPKKILDMVAKMCELAGIIFDKKA